MKMFALKFLFFIPLFFCGNFCFATTEGAPPAIAFAEPTSPTNLGLTTEKFCLSIDGGGLRGVFPAAVLREIEKKTGKKIHQLFPSGITGTSTGAFIALALSARKNTTPRDENNLEDPDDPYNHPLFEPRDLIQLYRDLATTVFPLCSVANCCNNIQNMPDRCGAKICEIFWKIFTCCGCCAVCKNCGGCCGPQYSNEALRDALTKRFGDRKLKDVLVPVQITSFKINKNGGPVYFTNQNNPEMLMVDAALASSAAPTFFPPVSFEDPETKRRVHCIDGGIYENNPVFAAFAYARFLDREKTDNQNPQMQDFYVLSVGTGYTQSTRDPSAFYGHGLLGWAKHVIDFGIFGTAAVADRNVLRLLGEENYMRINSSFDSEFENMDDPGVIDPLLEEVSDNQDIKSKIEKFARRYKTANERAQILIRDSHIPVERLQALLAMTPPSAAAAAAHY